MARIGSVDIPVTLGGLRVYESGAVPHDSYILVSPEGRMTLGKLIQNYDGLTLNEYQRQSMRTATAVNPHEDLDGWKYQLSGFGLGVAGEAGEVADILKKVLHHGHDMDPVAMKKELGDVLWYVQAIADRYGLTLHEVAQANIDKLKARYPNGWSAEDSINRDSDI